MKPYPHSRNYGTRQSGSSNNSSSISSGISSGRARVIETIRPGTHVLRAGSRHFMVSVSGDTHLSQGEYVTIAREQGTLMLHQRTDSTSPAGRGTRIISSFDIEHTAATFKSLLQHYETHGEARSLQQIIEHAHSIADRFPSARTSQLHVIKEIARYARKLLHGSVDNESKQRLVAQLRYAVAQLGEVARINVSGFHTDTPRIAQLDTNASVQARLSLFNSVSAARKWLSHFDTDMSSQQLAKLLQQANTGAGILIKTVAAPHPPHSISFLDGRWITQECSCIRASLSNPVWQQLSSDDFSQLLEARGSISLTRLRELDHWLTAHSKSVNHAAFTSSQTRHTDMQWLLHALDERIPVSSLPKAPFFASASNLVSFASQILPSSSENASTRYSGQYPADLFTLHSPEARSRLIPETIGHLGYGLERDLAVQATQRTTQTPAHSIKKTMLLLQALLQSPQNASVPSSGHDSTSAPSQHYHEFLPRIVRIASLIDTLASPQVPQQIDTEVTHLQADLTRLTAGRTALDSSHAGTKAVSGLPLPQVPDERFQQLITQLHALYTRLGTLQDSGSSPAGTEETPPPQAGPAQSTALQRLAAEIRNMTEAALRRIESSILDSLNQQGEQSQNLQRAVQGALQRLESLQMLSRPAHTPQGEQHVVVIPVRMGDTVSDVRLRIVRDSSDKRDKKKRRTPRYNLHVEASPSRLGPVRAHLEYHSPHSIGCNIECARRESAQLLDSMRSEFVKAMRQQNLHCSSIAVRHRPFDMDPDGATSAPDSGRTAPRNDSSPDEETSFDITV